MVKSPTLHDVAKCEELKICRYANQIGEKENTQVKRNISSLLSGMSYQTAQRILLDLLNELKAAAIVQA